MSFSNWMSLLKDDVKLVDVVMPGSHNSGCRKMMSLANCQDGSLAEQFRYGVRQFCIRIDTNRLTKKIVYGHSAIKGLPIEPDLSELRRVMDENPSEFLILDFRKYGDDKLGPFEFKCHADTAKVNEIIARTIEPSKYAFTDFDDIRNVTMGDIRKSGKRYVLLNEELEYDYSVKFPYMNPWTPDRHGRKIETFVKRATEVFDQEKKNGIFVLQTQQTGGPGTEIGIVSPRKLNRDMYNHFDTIIDSIKNNPKYLSMVNVMCGDYMTADFFKAKKIIALNLLKGNVAEDKLDEFNGLVK